MERPKLEKELYKPLIDGAHCDSFGVLYRLRDTPRDKKPYDIYGTKADGRSLAIEVKQVDFLDLTKQFPWNMFEQHQKIHLMICSKLGGCSLPIIYCNKTKTMYVFNMKDLLDSPDHRTYEYQRCTLTKSKQKWVDWNKIMW